MKYLKPINVILFLSVMLVSCNKEKVAGSGEIISETRNVANFYSVSAYGSTEVYINYGPQYAVTVKGYENIVPRLKTIVENGTLIVKYENGVNISNDNSEIYITMPTLQSVSSHGSNEFKVTGNFIGMETFTASTYGSGDITIEGGGAKNVLFKISGSGDIEAFGFSTENAIVQINGSGDAALSVTQNLKATISGSGNVYYKGSPAIDASVSGSGKVIKQ